MSADQIRAWLLATGIVDDAQEQDAHMLVLWNGSTWRMRLTSLNNLIQSDVEELPRYLARFGGRAKVWDALAAWRLEHA